MSANHSDQAQGHRLLQLGMLLLLLGLLTGFAMPVMENPRMGLSSHLEGVINGIFLLGLGLIWPRLILGLWARRMAFWLATYGGFANWLATLLAAFWGAGTMMPIAGGGHQGSALQEALITALLLSLSAAMVAVCVLVLWGLRRVAGRDTVPDGAAGTRA
jgi:hydroxylaminobenzene mutase